MSQVPKIHFSTPILFAVALLLFFTGVLPIAPVLLAWVGCIQLLNVFAHRLPFRRAIHWMYALTFEGLAIVGVALMRFIPMSKQVLGKGRPILLVHGYSNHGSVWRLQKKRLEAKGLGPIYVINLGHPFKSISSYAEKLKAKVESIAKETGRSDLILVGHSMGGLVSCWYATQMAAPNTVTDIITIGSPFNGTPMARFALGINAREMRPSSPLLKQLAEAMQKDTKIRYHHIASRSDQLILPSASAIIPHHTHFIYEDMGHATLLYSRRVTEKLGEWLKREDL